MKFSIRTTLMLTSVIAVVLAIAIGLFRFKNHLEESVLNSYRLVSAGELFLDYKRSSGEWPRNWDALENHATTSGSRLFGCEDFDDLKNNIEVDFSLDLTQLDTTSAWSDTEPQIRIFVSRTGQTQGAIFDPNELIYLHLQRETDKLRTKP